MFYIEGHCFLLRKMGYSLVMGEGLICLKVFKYVGVSFEYWGRISTVTTLWVEYLSGYAEPKFVDEGAGLSVNLHP